MRRRTIPYIITLHDGWWISPNQFILGESGELAFYDFKTAAEATRPAERLPGRALILHRMLRSAACLTAVSTEFAEVCRKTGLDNVIAVENGVSLLPALVRSTPEQRVRLGHVGGMELHKGLPLLRNILRASAFKNLSLLVVDLALSPGSSRDEVWGATPVHIRAKVPQSQIGELYGAIDVLVAPSIWPESFGLVTREAVASGCWVIASDRGAIGGCVEDGRNGFIVDVGATNGLRDALQTIDDDPARFLQSPTCIPHLRQASDQAADLANLYERLLAEDLASRQMLRGQQQSVQEGI